MWSWIGFNLFILFLLALDLFLFHRKIEKVSLKRALISSGLWIAMALLFNVWIYIYHGKLSAVNFFTGYLIEKSLSIDNLFIFLLIFKYFNTPKEYVHRVLFWGILGAIVMRALFIFLGITLIHLFHWILYLFGLILIIAGIKMALHKSEEVNPEKNFLIKVLKKWMPVTSDYQDHRFFIKQGQTWAATPLFVTLITIETTDLLFAFDSIPAIMAITLDPFIIYTSNIFAILGLRSLYFALEGIMELFHFLHYGLALILVFIGVKMLIAEQIKIPIEFSLGFILITLLISIFISICYKKTKNIKKH